MIAFVPQRFDDLQSRFEAMKWFRSDRSRSGDDHMNEWNDVRSIDPPTGTVALKVSPLIFGLDTDGEIRQTDLDPDVFCEVTEAWTTTVPTIEPYMSASMRSGYWLCSYKYQVQVGEFGIRYDLDEHPDTHPESSHFHERHRTARGRDDGQPVRACVPVTFADFLAGVEQFVFEERVRQGKIVLDDD